MGDAEFGTAITLITRPSMASFLKEGRQTAQRSNQQLALRACNSGVGFCARCVRTTGTWSPGAAQMCSTVEMSSAVVLRFLLWFSCFRVFCCRRRCGGQPSAPGATCSGKSESCCGCDATLRRALRRGALLNLYCENQLGSSWCKSNTRLRTVVFADGTEQLLW